MWEAATSAARVHLNLDFFEPQAQFKIEIKKPVILIYIAVIGFTP
jgi:hypothetical protein